MWLKVFIRFNLKRRDIKMAKVFVICMAFLYMVLPGLSAAGSHTDNGNGTVTDSGTLLIWQQGESSAMTWDAALSYCEGLSLAGSTDWRLPNHKELLSLADHTRYNPSINTTFFPSTFSSYYWSSTTSHFTSQAYIVGFNDGNSYENNKTYSYYARCVRGGQ